MPPRSINEIVDGRLLATANIYLRLVKVLGTSQGFWLGLQNDFNLETRRRHISQQLQYIVF